MKKLVILGAGESGKGTAILAHKMGYQVWVSDAGSIAAEQNHNSMNAVFGGKKINTVVQSYALPIY